MSDRELSRSRNGSAAKVSRSRSGSMEKSNSRKESSSKKHASRRSDSRSRSRSHRRSSRDRRRGSRSRSHSRRRRHSSGSRSRSRSYDRRRSSKYTSRGDYYDDRRRDDRGSYHGGGRSRSRSPMSHRRRHLGDRENPTTSKCLGVFGLSLYTQERDLHDTFDRYGPIENLQIVYDHQTGKSRGFAFIYYRNLEDAVEAKEAAPGTEIDGRPIRVDYSITKRAHTPTPGVYLGRPIEGGYSRRRSRSPGYRPRGGRRSRSCSRSVSPRRY